MKFGVVPLLYSKTGNTTEASAGRQEKARRFDETRENLSEQRQYLMEDLLRPLSPVKRTPRTPDPRLVMAACACCRMSMNVQHPETKI